MKMNRQVSTGLFLGMLTLLAAPGAQAFVYLRAGSLDLHDFPNPPAKNSAADVADLNGVRKYQGTRTNGECKRASDEASASLMSFYGMTHAVLSRQEIALVKQLFADIGDDAGEFISPLKESFRRPRPFQRDSRIKLCVPMVGGYSYPSGHSTLGRVSARTFGLIFPERSQQLLERGDEVGLDRVIGAVHHPRDIEAGRLLGDQVFDALRRSPEFMHRIDEIRNRLRNRGYQR